MAVLKVDTFEHQIAHSHFFGNVHAHYEEIDLSAVTAADNYLVMPIPQGAEIHDVNMVVYDASNASVTVDVGLIQDGPGDFTDDTDYFLNDVSIAALGDFSSRATRHHRPFRVTHSDVALAVTFNTAVTQRTRIGFHIEYIYVGNL